MQALATILVALVALEHVYILILEMVLWTTPKGRKAFGMTPEQAEATKVLAANQGLYNGFLAAGLFWSPSIPIRPSPGRSNCFSLARSWSPAYMGARRPRGRFSSFRRFPRPSPLLPS